MQQCVKGKARGLISPQWLRTILGSCLIKGLKGRHGLPGERPATHFWEPNVTFFFKKIPLAPGDNAIIL